ncbi:unnamed protein product [Boreogadus saida]
MQVLEMSCSWFGGWREAVVIHVLSSTAYLLPEITAEQRTRVENGSRRTAPTPNAPHRRLSGISPSELGDLGP